jgi:SAM-dependent methyltransferase
MRAQPDMQELVLACYYDDPLLDAAKRFAGSEEWQAVKTMIPQEAGKALDVGAGRGIASFALANDGWDVVALEPDPSDLVGSGAIRSLAAQASMAIRVEEQNAENMTFPSDGFDLVYAREVLHHADDLARFCQQVARVLRPGGIFLACREHVISHRSDLPLFIENHTLHQVYDGEHAYLRKEYIQAITHSGLRIKRILGAYESALNFFPMRRQEAFRIIRHPVERVFGRKVSAIVMHPSFPFAGSMDKFLSWFASLKANYPGRLNSFIAYKPYRR